MSFLAPAALGLLSLSIPLVVLYMLRSRRRRLEVPSIRMWVGEEQYVSAALPWQRLKITAALILQLLALIAFSLLLARPFFQEETLLGPHTVLVIDSSGSMAMEGRLESAKAEARRIVGDASEARLVSVVEAGSRSRVLAAFSRDPEEAIAAIDSIGAGGGVEDLEGALRLARGLATPDRPSSILLLTDGGTQASLIEPVANVRHLEFWAVGDNVAITAFGTGTPGQGGSRVFIEIASFSNRRETVTAELAVDGLRVATVEVSLDPGIREQKIVTVDAGPGQAVEVELIDRDDSLPLDDRSALILGGGVDLSVVVTGEGSPFLDALLRSVDGVRPAVGAPPDLVIQDGGDASQIDRPAWLIAPEVLPAGLEVVGRLENPVVTFQRAGEPILEGLDLSSVGIAEADIVEAVGWLPLVQAGDVPLVLLGDIGGHRAVYFAFDLARSNLPVDVAFPILGARLLDWLGGNRLSTAGTASAGTPLPLTTPAGGAAQITLPGGELQTVSDAVLEFTDTEAPGTFAVEYAGPEGAVVAGFLAARQFVAAESAGPSRTILTVSDAAATPAAINLLREWGPLILMALLVLVLLEWWMAFGRPRPWRTSGLA